MLRSFFLEIRCLSRDDLRIRNTLLTADRPALKTTRSDVHDLGNVWIIGTFRGVVKRPKLAGIRRLPERLLR